MLQLNDLTSIEIGLILLCILLLSILFAELLDWSRVLKLPDCVTLQYGYRNHNGTFLCKIKIKKESLKILN